MKKYLMMLLLLGALCPVSAQETISVEDIQLPQGDKAALVVDMNFNAEHDYVSYQFTVSLPEGVTLDADQYGKAAYTLPDNQPSALFTVDFPVSSSIFKCYSSPSTVIAAHTGTLVSIPIVADESLPIGTKLTGHLTGIVFSHADAVAAHFDDVEFNIEITEKMTILDENATTLPGDAEDVKVCVRRTITAGAWSTICLPFAMNEAQTKAAFGDDVQIADFTGCEVTLDEEENVTDIQVNFQPVTAMEANHPYIIKVKESLTEFTADGVDIIVEEEPTVDCDEYRTGSGTRKDPYVYHYNSMVGTYMSETEVPELCLFLSGNQFWYSTGATKMKAFRAYFDFYDVLTAVEAGAGARPALQLNFNDEATGIGDVSHLNDKGEMINDKSYYTIEGVKLLGEPSQRGVYIVNGKKVVVK